MLIRCGRVELEELLDRPDIPAEDLERSLSDLEWTNRWLGGRTAVLPHVLPLLGECSAILDVGCGSADILRAISDECRRTGRDVRLVGADIHPAVLASARERCGEHHGIELVQASAPALPFEDGSFDIVFSSTCIHHLCPEDVVQALRESARVAKLRVVVADLIRSRIGLLGVRLIGRFTFGRLSRCDGPASFRRAYRPDELVRMADHAGFSNRLLHMHGFRRMTLVHDKRRR